MEKCEPKGTKFQLQDSGGLQYNMVTLVNNIVSQT